MKKLFLYVFLGLLWCNVGFAENIKDMAITCSSNDYSLKGKFDEIITKENHTYEINIVNNVASLEHSTNLVYHNYKNYPLYAMNDKEYLFEMSNTPENIHSHIHFNRIKGTAIISYFEYFKNNPSEYVAFEFIRLKNCKASDIDDKPKF
jgi:hypothetical protein